MKSFRQRTKYDGRNAIDASMPPAVGMHKEQGSPFATILLLVTPGDCVEARENFRKNELQTGNQSGRSDNNQGDDRHRPRLVPREPIQRKRTTQGSDGYYQNAQQPANDLDLHEHLSNLTRIRRQLVVYFLPFRRKRGDKRDKFTDGVEPCFHFIRQPSSFHRLVRHSVVRHDFLARGSKVPRCRSCKL